MLQYTAESESGTCKTSNRGSFFLSNLPINLSGFFFVILLPQYKYHSFIDDQ